MKVWVTIWQHEYGEDVEVFTSPELAEKHRQEIADEWWDEEMDEPRPADPRDMATRYFQFMGEMSRKPEFFNVYETFVRDSVKEPA